jgi:tRNA modification GTPase
MEKIMGLIVKAGARQARPGEFTQRAYLGGRMDLAQAEAVLDLINAGTEKAASLAYEQLGGKTSKEIGKIREQALCLLAKIEVSIDFPDDLKMNAKETLDRAENIRRKVADCLAAAESARQYREGVRVAIIGKPNVGKSTLLNALAKFERAIVSRHPGTTRDTIEEQINLRGIPARVIDTAGIREARGEIEGQGAERARQEIERADLVVVVMDGSKKPEKEDREIVGLCRGKAQVIALNKKDLGQKIGVQGVWISALKGEGIEELEEAIHRGILGQKRECQILLSARQVEQLERANEALQRAAESIKIGREEELAAIDLRMAIEALDGVVGVGVEEEIIGQIFAKFCVGK